MMVMFAEEFPWRCAVLSIQGSGLRDDFQMELVKTIHSHFPGPRRSSDLGVASIVHPEHNWVLTLYEERATWHWWAAPQIERVCRVKISIG